MSLYADFYVGATSFLVSLVLGWVAIPYLRRLKIGQQIRAEGPKTHQKKAGTPTMGGLIFLLGPILALLLWRGFGSVTISRPVLAVLTLTASYALIGFIDDYRKIRRSRSLGLKAREKLILEILFAALFMWGFAIDSSYVIIPFTGIPVELGFMYPLFGIFLIVGFGNAVNLSDGLDGLAGGLAAIALLAYYFVFARAPGYLGLFQISPVLSAFIGGVLAFLVFNRHPAKVFMGDVGSLALGALLASLAIASRTELVLFFIAAVPALEAVSVILQVASFQLFGRRIFRMSPLHHHFELSGWPETRVVLVFWAVQAIFALLGVVSMTLVR